MTAHGPAADPGLPWWLGFATVVSHLPFLGRYGYHGDELYFLSCAARPDFGYVDHAPLVPWLAAATRCLGDSLLLLRLPACLAGGLTVALAGLLCRELGGGRFAVALAALATAVAPFFLRTASMFAIPSFEPVWWTLAALLLVRIVQRDRPRLWLAFGAVAGLGLLTKPTMLLWGFAISLALVLRPERRQLTTRWPWLGAGVALLLFLPNLVWQAANGWPTLAFAVRLNETVMAGIGRADFLLGQVLYAGPANALLWLPGAWLLLRRPGAPRLLGIAFVTVLGFLLLLQSKIYYGLPAYPVAFAAGGLFWEQRLQLPGPRRWLTAAVSATGLLLLPIGVPVLSMAATDRFAGALTFGLADKVHEITGDLHAMYGWPDLAAGMAAAHAALPAAERPRVLLLLGSYSAAGAVESFAPELPPILCNHMSWNRWTRALLATGRAADPVVLAFGFDEDQLASWFESVQRGARVEVDARAQTWLRNRSVFVCRAPRRPLADSWPERPSL